MQLTRSRTEANVDLTQPDQPSDVVRGGKPGGTLPVDGADGRRNWDARMQLSHACRGGTASGRKHVADSYVLNECGVEADLGISSAENTGEELLRARVLEATLLRLMHARVSIAARQREGGLTPS